MAELREREETPPDVARRRALARLGLASGAAYTAMMITPLKVQALILATPCPPEKPNCSKK